MVQLIAGIVGFALIPLVLVLIANSRAGKGKTHKGFLIAAAVITGMAGLGIMAQYFAGGDLEMSNVIGDAVNVVIVVVGFVVCKNKTVAKVEQ